MGSFRYRPASGAEFITDSSFRGRVPEPIPRLPAIDGGIKARHAMAILPPASREEEESTGCNRLKDQRAPSPMDRAKEEIKAVFHHEKIHHKETHGTSDDIDENTPIDRVKGPNLLERAKEEIEALIEAIHPKKSSEDEKAQ
ncbi:unnamed protein product [Spirodela intermedia]|uniref:Uncharacterized protein n=1 Tax=Spirodela intermedia TaxID=51605 RepID=A0A7I8JST6_SPIIN|nr:unnamed protein product [Spirodela intermedia]CAA6672811.1 unnamed protein product [Spirodela intermedia]